MKAAFPRIETVADLQVLADEQVVMRNLTDGAPIPDEVAQRIQERSQPIIERLRQTYGVIDDDTFQSLLSDDDDA
jgi:hypothetical protein